MLHAPSKNLIERSENTWTVQCINTVYSLRSKEYFSKAINSLNTVVFILDYKTVVVYRKSYRSERIT